MPSSTKSADVLIAGGGFAGLALAIGLSKSLDGELSVTVVSPAFPDAGTISDGRASALSTSSRRVLEALDVWPEIRASVQPVSSIEITDGDTDDIHRPARLTYDTMLPDGEPSMYIAENGALLSALYRTARAARGVTLVPGCSVTALATTADTATVTLSDGTTCNAKLAVAADGRRSVLRDQAGIKVVGWPYDQRAIVAFLGIATPHHGRAIQHFVPAGPFAILPLTGDRVCLTWSETRAEADRILALPPDLFMAEVERRMGTEMSPLRLLRPPQSWPLEMHLARAFIAERTALVGDAAHGIHPIAGQGINLGLRDVAALVETTADTARLGLDIGHGTTLERYQRWRRFDSVTATSAFDALNRIFSRSSPLERTVRGIGLSIVDRSAALKSWLVDEASGLSGDRPRMLDGCLP